MNRRGFFSLMAGAAVAAMAPALVSRPDYSAGQWIKFAPMPAKVHRVTMQLDGGPVRPIKLIAEASRDDGKTWRKVGESVARDGGMYIDTPGVQAGEAVRLTVDYGPSDIELTEIEIGPAFAAGGLGGDIVAADMGHAATKLLSTLTPPPIA